MVSNLIVRCGDESFLVNPGDTPEVTIGRAPNSTITLDYSWLSRTHLRVHVDHGVWVATDCSRNGIYRDGAKVATAPVGDGVTLRLGNPEGLEITLSPTDADQLPDGVGDAGPADHDHGGDDHDGDDLEATTSGEIDPDIARVGAAVAARRRQLDITQRSLARDKIINAGALIAFEKGRSWPRQRTRAALEEILQWPPGSIEALREGSGPLPGDEATQVIQSRAGSPLIVQSIKLALRAVDAAVGALPPPQSPQFLAQADAVLTDLEDLRRLSEDSARSAAAPSAEIGHLMIGIRRRIDEVMARTLQSPAASVGRRLYGQRRRAGLSAEEVAVITRLPLGTILAAESGQPISARDEAVIAGLLSELG